MGLLALRGTPFVHGDFRGGLNTKAANYLLEDNQCRDCLNVQSTSTGAIVKRNGCVGIGANLPDVPKSVFAVESTTTDHFLVAAGGALASTEGSGSTLADGFSSDTWDFAEATDQDGQGPVFMVNGTNPPQAYNGTALTAWTRDSASTLGTPDTAVPNGKYLAVHESRVVIAGESTNPSTLYWSEVQVGVGTLPRRWMIENQQLFDPNDGDVITGIGRVGSNLMVFKKHKVFVVYDLNTGANRRLTTNIGCVSHRSIVETPQGTFFLADSGVYVTNGSSVQLVSEQITPSLQALTNKSSAVGVVHENHYYLSFPDDATGTVGIDAVAPVFDYDLVLKSWWLHNVGFSETRVIYDFTTRFNDAVSELYGAAYNDVGQLFVPDTYTDFGSAYPWRWAGPWLAPGQARVVYPATRKRLRALRVDGFGRVKLTVDKDFYESDTPVSAQNPNGSVSTTLFALPESTTLGSSTTYFGDIDSSVSPSLTMGPTTFGDATSMSQARVWGQGVARSWSLTFENDESDLDTPIAAVIQNYTIFLQERTQ